MTTTPKAPGGTERRRSRRRPILSTFSLFIVVPKKGYVRLPVHDLSDLGIAFDIDAGGESPMEFPVKAGEKLDIRFYLNQSLYFPIEIQVVRVEDRPEARRVGAEFSKESPGYRAFGSFLNMLDTIVDVVRIDTDTQGEGA
jgi:hypothetical protein